MENGKTAHNDEQREESIRKGLYNQFGIDKKGKVAIRYILPILDRTVEAEARYEVDTRSKILAQIALYQAYDRAPKFKMFGWAALLLGVFDLLHSLNPAIYGIVFIALATLNGFIAALRSPSMMAAELEGRKDQDGMPANYRAKALSSVNTNVTLVLFVFAVGVQLFVTSSFVQTEIVTQNIADGTVNPVISALVLFFIPLIVNRN